MKTPRGTYGLCLALVPLVVAFLTACQPAPYRGTLEFSTRDKHLFAWEAQLEKYRADFVEKDKAIREESKEGLGTGLMEVSDTSKRWQRFVSRVFELSVMVRDAYKIAGRGETIKAFIIHMQSNPTPGLSESWFQRQAEEIQSDAQQHDLKNQAFLARLDEKISVGPEWISELETLARDQGMIQGRAEEIQSLYKQAMNYYSDVVLAKQEDMYQAEQRRVTQQQATQALFALGTYLNQLSYQQQLINALNRPRTCSVMGNLITCQ